MITFLLLFCGILLALLQTAIPVFTTVLYGCDLLLPFLVYLSLYRSFRSSLGIAITLGFIMDVLHTGTFGIYITTYLWLIVFMFWFQKTMLLNQFIWVLISAMSMLLETLLWVFVLYLHPREITPVIQLKHIIVPFVAMFVVAPISFVLYAYVKAAYERLFFVAGSSARQKRLS